MLGGVERDASCTRQFGNSRANIYLSCLALERIAQLQKLRIEPQQELVRDATISDNSLLECRLLSAQEADGVARTLDVLPSTGTNDPQSLSKKHPKILIFQRRIRVVDCPWIAIEQLPKIRRYGSGPPTVILRSKFTELVQQQKHAWRLFETPVDGLHGRHSFGCPDRNPVSKADLHEAGFQFLGDSLHNERLTRTRGTSDQRVKPRLYPQRMKPRCKKHLSSNEECLIAQTLTW